jgi:hypothetical protein
MFRIELFLSLDNSFFGEREEKVSNQFNFSRVDIYKVIELEYLIEPLFANRTTRWKGKKKGRVVQTDASLIRY